MASDADAPDEPGLDEDEQLLERWRAGDSAAGNRLVRKHYLTVTITFTNAVGDDERQDLVQETFGRLTTAKDNYRGEGGVRAYILVIAHRVLIDHIRRRYRGGVRFDPLTHTVEDIDGATPSQAVVAVQRTHRLLACLRALPVETKQMLEHYYWNDCTAEVLGRILGGPEGPLPAGTVRRRIHGAKLRLRACLETPPAAGDEGDAGLDAELRALGELLVSGPTKV